VTSDDRRIEKSRPFEKFWERSKKLNVESRKLVDDRESEPIFEIAKPFVI
jgi:hypothetical protein